MKQIGRYFIGAMMLLLIILSRLKMISVDGRDIITIFLILMLIFLHRKDRSLPSTK